VALRLAGAALVVMLFGLPLFNALGATDLETDEALYADIAQRMAESGDWLTLRYTRGEPFLEKPPLKFWIVAAGLRAGWFDADERGFRFWDPLLATLAFLYVFALGCRSDGPLCGVTAVFFLFVNEPLVLRHGLRAHTMEALLVLAYAGGLYHFVAWSLTPRRRASHAHLAAVGAWFAVAFLAKFAAALFLPAILAATLLWDPDARRKARADWGGWVLAGLVAAGAGLPWYLQQTLAHGGLLWETMLGQHVLLRFTSGLDPIHLHGWSYYLEWLWVGIEQTSLFVVPGALLWLTRAVRHPWPAGRAVFVWWALPLALLSLGRSKLYWYADPFLPPLGLFGGFAVSRLARAWTATLPRVSWRDSPALRTAAGLGAVAAGAIALATALHGPLRGRWVGLVFSNSTLERPLLLGSLLVLLAASRTGLAVGVVAALAAGAAAWPSYLRVWEQMGSRSRPASDLVRCLARRSGGGLWFVEDTPPLHQYDHYLRRFGVERHAVPRELLESGVLPPPPANAALLVEHDDRDALGRLPWWPQRLAHGRVVASDHAVLLLSGAYRACALPPHRPRGPFVADR
jgi:4-amino-4-deoxy-L-arabinose transferase-like glycosyltransferase